MLIQYILKLLLKYIFNIGINDVCKYMYVQCIVWML